MLIGILPALGSLQPDCPAAPLKPGTSSTSGKTTEDKSHSTTKTKPSKNRLPKYFAQLKLDDGQREQILKIQAEYASQVDAKRELMAQARKELDQLRKDQERDYNKVLKTSQRRRLKELRNRSERSARK
jgi:Spy/CpxP family protein refolding chaperone